MKRRNFLKSLAALSLAPALPVSALSGVGASVMNAGVRGGAGLKVVPGGAYPWAETIVRAHNKCTSAMLQRHLNLDLATANALKSQLVKNGVISAQANAYGIHTAVRPLFDGAFIKPSNPAQSAHDMVKEFSNQTPSNEEDLTADSLTFDEEEDFTVEELEEAALLCVEMEEGASATL